MTDRLSRRDFVALGGAGIALSAFGGKADAAVDNTAPVRTGTQVVDQREYIVAQCENHGIPASVRPKNGTESPFTEYFEAPYICIVHINLSAYGKLTVNYASFSMEGKYLDKDRLDKALSVLNEKLDKSNPISHFRLLANNKTYNLKDKEDFEDFGFKSPHEIFFYLEGGDIEIDDDPLVVFTLLSNRHPNVANDENNSFVNASVVSKAAMGDYLYSKGKMFRIRNYVLNEDGEPLDVTKDERRQYSMNIHFRVRCGTGAWIPMVIDPDTGNGAGHEP